jgi:hypothetical protein
MKKSILNLRNMKKVIPVFIFAAAMTACNTNPKTTDSAKVDSYSDTVGLAQFRAWKAQNELANPNTAYMPNQAVATQSVSSRSTATRRTSSSSNTARRSTASSSGNSGSMSSTSSNTAMKKKGWSKAAKGAVIGGVAGGVAGAVINKKNRVVGGVIGGVLGAGAGYGIGRGMDKRDGRY